MTPLTLEQFLSLAGPRTSAEEAFVASIVRIGPLIPELLAVMDSNARPIKEKKAASCTTAAEVDVFLEGLPWLGKPKHLYRYGDDGLRSDAEQIPVFARMVPHSVWSYLVLRLSQRLGISSWNWKIQQLKERGEGLEPRMIEGRAARSGARFGLWLRKLSPEHRSAWTELAGLIAKVSDERCLNLCTSLVIRGATVMHQSHVVALRTLREAEAPLAMLWDLERWIVSPEYTQVRRSVRTANRVPVPLALGRLPSMVEDRQGR